MTVDSRQRRMMPIYLTVGFAGVLGAIVELLSSEYIVALAVLGMTIALILALVFSVRSRPSEPGSRFTSAMAIASVGAIAVIIGLVLWVYFGTIDHSVSLFTGGVGFIAGGAFAARIQARR